MYLAKGHKTVPPVPVQWWNFNINTDSLYKNSVDPDQLASEEAS